MPNARQDEIEWLPGHFYHLYNRGARRVTIFREERNYIFALTRINEYCTAFSLTLIAYVLMPNHYHFLVRQDKDVPAGLLPQRVFNSYSKAYNKLYQHSGTLFEGRFKAIPFTDDAYLRHLCRYIHANPVKDGIPRLNVEHEWTQIQDALAELCRRGDVILERLDAATLDSLQRRLQKPEPVHVFHFIGHGTFDSGGKGTGLLLETLNGEGRLVTAEKLKIHFRDHRSLRLAFLNACEGAQTGPRTPFGGIAQILIKGGLPAVIAMQSKVTDQTAIKLAYQFYRALATHHPVDAALAEARKAINNEDKNILEWGIPVLYMRTSNGNLFEW